MKFFTLLTTSLMQLVVVYVALIFLQPGHAYWYQAITIFLVVVAFVGIILYSQKASLFTRALCLIANYLAVYWLMTMFYGDNAALWHPLVINMAFGLSQIALDKLYLQWKSSIRA